MDNLQAAVLGQKNNSFTPIDPEEFRRQGHILIDFLANYYQNVEKYPVMSQVEPGYLKERLSDSAPYHPEPFENILQDVQDHIIPGITHWMSPKFFGFFPCCASTAGFLGEMLSTGFNVVGFNWLASPAATELESIVMDWLGKLLKLPESFLFCGGGGGVLQGTTCEAVLCTVIAARDQKLSEIGRDNINKLVVYCSDQTHSAFQKAARLAGIHPDNIRSITTTKSALFALSPSSLRLVISSDLQSGLIPLFLCATLGTTSTTAMDPLGPLSEVARDYGMWVHVDAAHAGSACICPEFQKFLDGVEGVNSMSLNAHKWLFANLDCCCLWVKDPNALIKSLSSNPEFLRNKASDSNQVVDYKDWQITLSRRFRALKLWLVLRSYGVVNLRSFFGKSVDMAKHFEGLVEMDNRFEVFTPRTLALVCFRLSPKAIVKLQRDKQQESQRQHEQINELNKKLLESINASGRVFMTHTIVEGIYVIRFAAGGSLTEDRHVILAWKVVQEHTDKILVKK